jgi:ribose-phosphate pyrophosphokinase
MADYALKLFYGNAHKELAREIAEYLKIPLSKIVVSPFPDGETLVEIQESVRGEDVFIIQPTCPPVNNNIMELLLMIDAAKRASARRVTAVVPYFGYARQDRKVKPRVPISSKLAANLITTAGANRVLSVDLHAGQIQGFFDIPVDHLFAAPVLIDYFKKKELKNFAVVSPDAGGVERTRAFAKRLNAPMAIVDKRRSESLEVKAMNVVGDVKNKHVLLVDDMIDRAGTLAEAVRGLKENGALDIYCCATHAVFSEPAMERIESCEVKEVIVTNTIPPRDDYPSKVTVLSIAPLLGEAIKRIHCENSVSCLFV